MLRLAALATLVAHTDALYWMSTPRYDFYSSYYMREPVDVEPEPSPHWRVSRDAYEIKVRLPDLEPSSVKAALGVDGTKVEVVGERKIEGCTCQPSTVKEISLPFRPRAEDIDIAYDKDGGLSMRLLRQPAKAEATTPLPVSVTSTKSDKHEEAAPATEAETRKLRFVPHESAHSPSSTTPPSLDEQEKNLTDKFRAAGLATVAVQHGHHGEPSAKEAAATTAEGAADAKPGDAAKA